MVVQWEVQCVRFLQIFLFPNMFLNWKRLANSTTGMRMMLTEPCVMGLHIARKSKVHTWEAWRSRLYLVPRYENSKKRHFDASLSVQWYRKENYNGVLLHFHAAWPDLCKRIIVAFLLHKIYMTSSKKKYIIEAHNNLSNNQYSSFFIERITNSTSKKIRTGAKQIGPSNNTVSNRRKFSIVMPIEGGDKQFDFFSSDWLWSDRLVKIFRSNWC